jgi:hypothetical protein
MVDYDHADSALDAAFQAYILKVRAKWRPSGNRFLVLRRVKAQRLFAQ